MKKKLVNKDPFSNGMDEFAFETRNCELCIKGSVPVDGYCVMALKRDEEVRMAEADIDEEQLYWMFYVLMKMKPYGVIAAMQAVDEIIDEMRREEEDGDEILNTMKHFINKKK